MSLLELLRSFLKHRATDAYLVGGAVRDVLLGRESHDVDISVRVGAADLARAFADEIGGAYYLMDESFDVARVILERDGAREIVDVARLRGGSIEQDLATRDFTVNAMAADALAWDGHPANVIDPFHGRADLEAGLVRALSDRVFRADAVRLLRAVRMQVELGFALESDTRHWIQRDAEGITAAPMERVRDELVRIIGGNNVFKNLHLLDELGLLGRVIPELNPLRDLTQSAPHIYNAFDHTFHAVAAAEEMERARYANLVEGAFSQSLAVHFAKPVSAFRTRRELLRFALLFHDTGKAATRTVEVNGRIRFFGHEAESMNLAAAALRRLKFTNDEIALVKTIVQYHMRPLGFVLNGISDRAIHRYFRATGEAGVDIAVHAWCDQQGTFGAATAHPQVQALMTVIARLLDAFYNAHQRVVAPPALLTGDDIMQALRLPPGRRIGELLEALGEAQAEGEIGTRQGALAWLKKFDPPA